MTVYMCIACLGYSNRTNKHDKLCTQHRGSYSDKKPVTEPEGSEGAIPRHVMKNIRISGKYGMTIFTALSCDFDHIHRPVPMT